MKIETDGWMEVEDRNRRAAAQGVGLTEAAPNCKHRPYSTTYLPLSSIFYLYLHHPVPLRNWQLLALLVNKENNQSEMVDCVNNPRRVHGRLVACGGTKCVYTSNQLIKAYTCLGMFSHAHRLLLYGIPHPNIVSWTILISGLSKSRLFSQALSCFRQMLSTGLLPNHFTLSSILPAFSSLGLVSIGKSLHAFCLRRLYAHNVITDTCFVHMYSRFGCMPAAHLLFDEMPLKNIASWNVIISGYANNGMSAQALRLFNLMRLQNVCFLDHVTFMSLIPAASTPGWGSMTSAIHCLILKSGYNREQQVQTALIKMYASSNFIDEAHCVFCEMPVTDVVAWTLMLEGFSSCQQWSRAIQHFGEMMRVHGKALDSTAVVGILSSCSAAGAFLHGRRVHALIVKQGFSNDVYVASALIDMYTNCGDLDSGKRFFDATDQKDVACWNAMIKAMGANGNGEMRLICCGEWKLWELGQMTLL